MSYRVFFADQLQVFYLIQIIRIALLVWSKGAKGPDKALKKLTIVCFFSIQTDFMWTTQKCCYKIAQIQSKKFLIFRNLIF